MKLIIDISEDVYTRLFDNGIQDNEIAVDDICEIARALRLGTPLDDVTEAISEAYANTHYMYPEYASGLSHVYGIIDKCSRKAEREKKE